ncbi:MAG: hypothetical protein KDK36_02500, partial [Leptospiraceae bacterium]|nr:hypothetical protein [Leptospiraceae bacterium]
FTDKLYSELGMNYIVKKILKTENVYLNERLNKVTKNYDSLFELHFDSGLQVTTEKLIITIPLPQAIEVLDENHFLEWIQFSKPHSEYRPCLVIVEKWRKTRDYIFDALSKLPKFTFLDPGHDLEYISIESEKFKDGHNLCVMIQLGENFSKKHLENWIEPNKFPTDFAVNSSTELFNNFFKLYDIPVNTEADFLRVHKWKYSQPINPLFENLDYMDFDSDSWKNYISLYKKTGMALTADWVFGKRIINSALGATILANEIKKIETLI